ncbi:hypothetical protein MA5S0421_5089 [Mycobacteroides abscessus 5S-0421]|nr:hypothetical protein MA5S0421_5089 [Mycobacteroides abscessus 5S-0421]EIU11496.1 hypothetical protein MA5S0304_4855 [Mycobacteroides abscessus 5S-0304]
MGEKPVELIAPFISRGIELISFSIELGRLGIQLISFAVVSSTAAWLVLSICLLLCLVIAARRACMRCA